MTTVIKYLKGDKVIWFTVLGGLGVHWILEVPQVLLAIDPSHALGFFQNNRGPGFFVLGAVLLVVTGGEALYADMGHFGRRPIRYAWFFAVLPALLLNYLGQGALLIRDPSAIQNPFFRMAPSWGLLPLVFLSTSIAQWVSNQITPESMNWSMDH